MNDKIYKIFISSTYKDLKEQRQKVIDTIIKMQYLPVGMEMFNASSDSQWKIITDTIDDCDYYVLILGKRYGSLIQNGSDKGLSYTEREFRYAKKYGIPYLAFIISDDADVKASNVESDPAKLESLNKFKKLVEENGTVNYWKNADELAGQVRSSLESEIKKHPRNGWIKSNSKRIPNYNDNDEDEDVEIKDYDYDKLIEEGIDVSNKNILTDYLNGMYETDEKGWYYRKVPDGKHIRRSLFKDLKLEEGVFKDDKLLEGVSYNWILKFWKNTGDEEDSYIDTAPTIQELTEDETHEHINWSIIMQYEADAGFILLEDYIENEGLDMYYVADKNVSCNGKKIKLFNIRTLESFLLIQDPKKLKYLKTGEIELDFEEEVEDIDFSELVSNKKKK